MEEPSYDASSGLVFRATRVAGGNLQCPRLGPAAIVVNPVPKRARPCGTVVRTIYVPECTTEMRTVTRTRYHQEQRERQITVYKRVPITEEKTANYTVMVPETRTKTVTYNVCKPVWETQTREYTVNVPYTEPVEQKYTVCVPYTEPVEQKYTVCVPYTETKEVTYNVCVPYTEAVEATRTVVKCVPVTTTKTVNVCGGHWETQQEEVPCGGCGGLWWLWMRRLWRLRHADRLLPCLGADERDQGSRLHDLRAAHRRSAVHLQRLQVPIGRPHPHGDALQVPTEERTRTVNVCKTRTEERTRT